MINRIFLNVFLAGFCVSLLFKPALSQYVPYDISLWTKAGYSGEIPRLDSNTINVIDKGAVADGISDNYEIIQALIDKTESPVVLYFPEGTYRINGQLEMKSGVVLRGAGSQATHLEFDSAEGCFLLEGSNRETYSAILSGLKKGSNAIVVADASDLKVGEGAYIRQGNVVEPTYTEWIAKWSLGQMIMITAIEQNKVQFTPALNFDYASNPPLDEEKQPQISGVNFIEHAGIEQLHIKRLHRDDESAGSNINTRYAANFWIRDVESEYTLKYHFAIRQSLNFEIRECCIHHARSKGNGGQGYGISVSSQSTAGLVENNIIYECRHALIIQLGVSGCVFGYNFAARNYDNEGWDKTYISLHGHYVHRNLFEGNVAGWIGIGDYWGPDGPDNTFFRNHVLGTDRSAGFGDNRGIWYSDFRGPQYIVANELTGGSIYYIPRKNRPSDTSMVVIHGNNINGTVSWEPDIKDRSFPDTYYLDSAPYFFKGYNWPPFGGETEIGKGTIPAWERWKKKYCK